MERRRYVSRDPSPTVGGARDASAFPAVLLALLLGALLLAPGCTTAKRLAYEGFGGRDGWQQPDRVVSTLALEPGAKVADLGAGGGYFAFRLAEAVGPEGRVYAVDVDEGMNDYVRDEAAERGLAQLEVVLADADDPRLPEPVDLLFTSNTYHHLGERVAYFRKVRERYLRPGGRLAIVDFDPEHTSHSTSPETIRSELGEAGFRLVEDHSWLERQAFLIFSASE